MISEIARRRGPRCLAFLLPTVLGLAFGCGSSARDESEAEGQAGESQDAGRAGRSGGAGRSSSGGSAGASSSGSGGGISVETAGAGGDCEREVTLQAVVLGEPAPFDLVIVADHSGSLAWSRDELAAGLSDLLTNVEGRDVRIFLLTPTQYGESSSPARKPLTGDAVVAWQDPMTGEAFAPAMTDYEQHCTDEAGASIECQDPRGSVPYVVEGTWSFRMPDPIAVITADMTDAEFAAEQVAVADTILSLGGSGSSHEQPLCTLSRYVSQDAELLPENAVFLIISDEDDVSEPDDCLKSFRGELKSYDRELGSSPCSADCDVYRYEMTGLRHWERLPFTCSAFTDMGEQIPGTDMSSWYNLAPQPNCDGIEPGPCTPEETAQVQEFCDSGLVVSSCERECATQEFPCRLDFTAPVDACNGPFEYGGRTWANLPTYCAEQGSDWHDCVGGGLDIQYETTVSGTYRQENLMEGENTSAVGNYFQARALAAFGSGKFLVEGIVFDPAFSCTLGTGQSYATNLVRTIGDSSRVFSLCDSYAPALAGVLDFARALIQTEFTLSLKDDEQVTAVFVIRATGAERRLSPSDYSFDETTQVLSISPSAITATDANLRVEVTSDCRPIVR
jgi:hypothetical protein